jgi:hypothetical protein
MPGQATQTEEEVTRFIEQLMQAIEARKQANPAKPVDQKEVAELIEKQLKEYEEKLSKAWARNLAQVPGGDRYNNDHEAGKMLNNIRQDIGGLDFAHHNLQQKIAESLMEKVSSEGQKLIDPRLQDQLGASILMKGLAQDLKQGRDQGGNQVKLDINVLDNRHLERALNNQVTKGAGNQYPLRTNEHWDKVREYQNMRNEYLSAKVAMERTKKEIEIKEKQLKNLHNQNSSFYRLMHGGKKPDKATHIENKLKLTNQIDDLKDQLKQAEGKVQEIRGKAHQTYKEHTILPSSSHHITQKLDELIKQERKAAIQHDREHPAPLDRGYRSGPQPVPQHVQPQHVQQQHPQQYVQQPNAQQNVQQQHPQQNVQQQYPQQNVQSQNRQQRRQRNQQPLQPVQSNVQPQNQQQPLQPVQSNVQPQNQQQPLQPVQQPSVSSASINRPSPLDRGISRD